LYHLIWFGGHFWYQMIPASSWPQLQGIELCSLSYQI
jgi:hypothetical protein